MKYMCLDQRVYCCWGYSKHFLTTFLFVIYYSKTVSEYDQEILQLHTDDQPAALRGNATKQ